MDIKFAIPVKYQKLFFQFNAPETRGGILKLQLGYRPGSTIQEQGWRKHLSTKKEMIDLQNGRRR